MITDTAGGNSDDQLVITDDGTNYIIEDTNMPPLVLGRDPSMVGATTGANGEIIVPKNLVTGGLIVDTVDGTDTVTLVATDGDLDFDGPIVIMTDTINLNANLTAVDNGGEQGGTPQNITFDGNVNVNAPVTVAGQDIVFEKDVAQTTAADELIVATEGNSEIKGAVTGAADLRKNGAGTLVLSGNSTSTGRLLVAQGNLFVTGTTTHSGLVTNGSVLGGTGTIFGPVTMVGSGGELSPGLGANNVGELTVDWDLTTVTLTSNSSFVVDLSGNAGGAPVAGTDYDQLDVDGFAATVNLSNAELDLNVDVTDLAVGDKFTIMELEGGTVNGTFVGLADDTAFTDPTTNAVFTIDYNHDDGGITGDGDDVVLTFEGIAETFVSINALTGNLDVTDITNDTADMLTIRQSFNQLIITDPNVVLATDIPGATQPDEHTVIVDLSDPFVIANFSGFIHVMTENASAAADSQDDTLTVDFASGAISRTITFDGGSESAGGGDQLNIANGNFGDVTHQMTADESGTLNLGPFTSPINYTDLEVHPIDLTTSMTQDVILNLPGGTNNHA